jgi:cytosine/adenosine deaminase-related metal-dependent hydrolase
METASFVAPLLARDELHGPIRQLDVMLMISLRRQREESAEPIPVSGGFREVGLATSTLLKARWIFPVASEPIMHGAIEICERRIAAIYRRPPQEADDLGDVAIMPGFVNAHTHLEFSDLAEPLTPSQPFPAWLRKLMAYRRQRGDAEAAVRHGLDELEQQGTVGFGEIVTQNWQAENPADVPGGVLFRELIGLLPESIDSQLEIAARHLEADDSDESAGAVRGLSPHAPYSVHPRLFERAIALAASRHAPLTMHLAETQAELQLLRDGTGDLVEFLSALGVWRDGVVPRSRRPLDYLRAMAGLDRVVIAHGNYFDDEEIEFVACHRNFAVAYCPRTHAFFGHAEHPWRKLIERRGLVAIGTDGRGSTPDLSIWNELVLLAHRYPEIDPAVLLQLGTLNGARALGREEDYGTLEKGKSARAAIISLGTTGTTDPYAELFHPQSRVLRLLVD